MVVVVMVVVALQWLPYHRRRLWEWLLLIP